MKIIFLYGISGSGKTYYSKQLLKNDDNLVHVNKDLIRNMLNYELHKHSSDFEKLVLKVRDDIIISALNRNKDVIVDDTNFPFGGRHYQRIIQIAKRYNNVIIEEKFIDVSLEEAIKRNKNPGRIPVPEEVITRQYNKYVKDKKYTCKSEVISKEITLINAALPYCVIFDIDGTLAHMNHKRSPFDWHKVDKDDVDFSVAYLNNAFVSSILFGPRKDSKILIFSGRDEVSREKTERWLVKNNIVYDGLFMRKEKDQRSDYAVKQELYNTNIKNVYNVICVVDDRDSVVGLWRSLGLKCLQADYGDF